MVVRHLIEEEEGDNQGEDAAEEAEDDENDALDFKPDSQAINEADQKIADAHEAEQNSGDEEVN